MSQARTLHALLIAASMALGVLLVAFNITFLKHAHDSRATHLDTLIAVDSVAILITAWSVHLLFSRRQRRR